MQLPPFDRLPKLSSEIPTPEEVENFIEKNHESHFLKEDLKALSSTFLKNHFSQIIQDNVELSTTSENKLVFDINDFELIVFPHNGALNVSFNPECAPDLEGMKHFVKNKEARFESDRQKVKLLLEVIQTLQIEVFSLKPQVVQDFLVELVELERVRSIKGSLFLGQQSLFAMAENKDVISKFQSIAQPLKIVNEIKNKEDLISFLNQFAVSHSDYQEVSFICTDYLEFTVETYFQTVRLNVDNSFYKVGNLTYNEAEIIDYLNTNIMIIDNKIVTDIKKLPIHNVSLDYEEFQKKLA